MILPIYLGGQPVLRQETAEVTQQTFASQEELQTLLTNMFDTLRQAEGVGLAAPQVGLSLRLLVIDATEVVEEHPECKGFRRVMINPEITERSGEAITLEEGCLSFPGIHEKVERAAHIRVNYLNERFEVQSEEVHGFSARIVQHECDHLGGHVFLDHVSPIRRQLNQGKLLALRKGTTHCNYKVQPPLTKKRK
ncbi:MAG: peptide deformylase [Tannerellaceae bacterium]|jgi:peptide deformylase|nr:peptide deformylase [Tannerellaceae bacterium]